MEAVDFISQIGDDSEETFFNYKTIGNGPQEEINPLNYYYNVDSHWVHNEIPAEINRIRLGKNPYECEIRLTHNEADDVHIVLQRTGNSWHIIESGQKELMQVNGLKRRQYILEHGNKVVIQLGEMIIIFSTAFKISPKQKNINETFPEETSLEDGEYSLSHNGISKKFPYKKICIFGSDPICDIIVPGTRFSAMVTNYEKKLFITNISIYQKTKIEADNIQINYQAPLVPGSKIIIDGSEINFRVSKDFRFTKHYQFAEDEMHLDQLRLLVLDNDWRTKESYNFPNAGSSVSIGRDSKQCKMIISGNSTISRIHCKAIIYQKRIMLFDEGSTNGCFVNGEKIKKRMIRPGDMIKLGDLNCILCFRDQKYC